MRLSLKHALLIFAASFACAGTAQAAAAQSSRAAPLPRTIAAGNLPGCLEGSLTDPAPLMKMFKATVLRVVINGAIPKMVGSAVPKMGPRGANGETLPCVAAAQQEGYKVLLVFEWNAYWSPRFVRQFIAKEMKIYGRYTWAVGVGNEEEITPRLSGSGYSRDWRAVEPLLKQSYPKVIRVAGEISPWGLPYLTAALRAGLPGMQALAVHFYRYKWSFTMPQVLALAHRYGVPLWCDEGLYDGPDSWRPAYPRGGSDPTLSQLRGAALAGVWDRF